MILNKLVKKCSLLRVREGIRIGTNIKRDYASTVDSNEIENMSKHASDWWSSKSPVKPLHSMNQLRVPFIRDNLISVGKISQENRLSSKPLTGLQILDVGCGGGILTEPLARIGATVTGIDASEELINIAKNHVKNDPEIKDSITYLTTSVEDFALQNQNIFDVVVSSEVVEHVSKKDVFLKSAVSTIKPGGSIFITTLSKTYVTWFAAIILGEYICNIVPKGTHEYDKLISPHELQRLLEINACTTRIIQGMMYNPIQDKWNWVPYKIHYALHAVKD